MQAIELKKNPTLAKDKNGKPRWMVVLKDGRNVTKARWMMMNFLHTDHIPKKIHIHHENEISDDDRIENFELKLINDHMRHHNPYDYTYGVPWTKNKNEHERNRRALIPELQIKSNANALRYYYEHKDDPIFQEKLKGRRVVAGNKHKNDPEFKIESKTYRDNYFAEKKQDPEWVAKHKKKKKQYHLTSMSKPGAREKERVRVKEYRIRKIKEAQPCN